MFTVARLRDLNKRVGHTMRSYTSANGNKYTAGTSLIPAAWKIIIDPKEANELREISQFQVVEVETKKEIDEMVQRDMEDSFAMGKAPVRAAVAEARSTSQMSRTTDDAKREAAQKEVIERAATMLRPTPIGNEADETQDMEVAEKPQKETKVKTPKPSGRRGRSSRK